LHERLEDGILNSPGPRTCVDGCIDMPAPGASDPIDVVDDQNRIVGVAPRGAVLDDGVNFRTAHVLITADHGTALLLQRLPANRDRHGGRWGSSVAAYIHAGEAPEDAARRRLREELQIAPPLEDLGTLATHDQMSTKFVSIFTTAIGAGTVAPDADHIDALRQWSLAEIEHELREDPEGFTPTFRAVFGRFAARSAT
jgi:isopentenyl-diphosphate Delta-isomerase